MENSVFFRVEKSGIFIGRPVLDSGHWTGQLGTVDSGQWTVDSGQWTVDGTTGQLGAAGQWTVDSGQWTVDSGQWTGHPVLDRGGSGQWTRRLDSGRDRVDRSTVPTLEY